MAQTEAVMGLRSSSVVFVVVAEEHPKTDRVLHPMPPAAGPCHAYPASDRYKVRPGARLSLFVAAQ